SPTSATLRSSTSTSQISPASESEISSTPAPLRSSTSSEQDASATSATLSMVSEVLQDTIAIDDIELRACSTG
ncbi:unnamed protein product, partial [Adineta steineri]